MLGRGWCVGAVEGDEVGGGATAPDLGVGEHGEVQLQAVTELGEDPADDPVRWADPLAQHVEEGSVTGKGAEDGLLDRTDRPGARCPAGRGDAEGGVDVGERVGCPPTQRATNRQGGGQRFALAQLQQPGQQPPVPVQLVRPATADRRPRRPDPRCPPCRRHLLVVRPWDWARRASAGVEQSDQLRLAPG